MEITVRTAEKEIRGTKESILSLIKNSEEAVYLAKIQNKKNVYFLETIASNQPELKFENGNIILYSKDYDFHITQDIISLLEIKEASITTFTNQN